MNNVDKVKTNFIYVTQQYVVCGCVGVDSRGKVYHAVLHQGWPPLMVGKNVEAGKLLPGKYWCLVGNFGFLYIKHLSNCGQIDQVPGK